MLGSAGHINTVMYLLNYYGGIDTEIKDCRGFTALIKAAMTGRTEVVATLVMAGTQEPLCCLLWCVCVCVFEGRERASDARRG